MKTALAFLVLGLLPQEGDLAQLLVREAEGKQRDRALLLRSLSAVDEETKKTPANPNNHYARGWFLSRLGRPDESVAAYDEATRLKPSMADAAYNAGVVLSGNGKPDEAVAHWKVALAADPKHVDALYNLGQFSYNRKDFKVALDYWSKARGLDPTDFNILKKVLQSHHALGHAEEASKARQALLELRKTSEDPRVRALKSVVFDQFDVGKAHVYAIEMFEPEGDLYSVYRFQVVDAADVPQGTVDLESSAAIRELGTPYVLGLSLGPKRITTDQFFKALPSYADLKPLLVPLVEKHFEKLVKGTPQ
ncbi:MAG TPA: tetratricopeptide repeat protein [Planctomycetota bacterium]|nr:tetratricopeptide repeat protein [Planctomycetota bacterium]